MLFPAEEGLATPPMHLLCQSFFCNKALNKMPLVSSVDSYSPNLSQLPLVAPSAFRWRSDPHLVLLIERISKLWPKRGRPFCFRGIQRYTEQAEEDTVQQA